MNGPDVCRAIAAGRIPLSTEKETQAAIDLLLLNAFGEDNVRREARLSPRDVPDFLVGERVNRPGDWPGVAVEVKIKGGQKAAIWRQLERYAAHPQVTELVLATANAMGLPETCGGKPIYYLSLGRAWL